MDVINAASLFAVVHAEDGLAVAIVLVGFATVVGVLVAFLTPILLVLLVPFTHGTSVMRYADNVKASFWFGLKVAAFGLVGLALTIAAYQAYVVVLP